MVLFQIGMSVAVGSRYHSVLRLLLRGVVLFIIGVLFSLVLNLLQVQRQVTQFPDIIDNVFSSAWWVPPTCGTAAGKMVIDYELDC